MPGIHTHLNLALRLLKVTEIDSPTAFLLGNAYPDCFDDSFEMSVKLHYKNNIYDSCDLRAFLEKEEKNDFNYGYYFHLWVDNYMRNVDVKDISKSDCLICDMEMIATVIQELKKNTYTAKERQSMQNILSLEKQPMPCCLVSEAKKQAYEEILNSIVWNFKQSIKITDKQIKD